MYKVLQDKAHDISFYDEQKLSQYEQVISMIIQELQIDETTPELVIIEKINEYLKENVVIRSNYFRAMIEDSEFDERELTYRTGYAELIKGEAICAGFTEATRSLLEACGIESTTLISKLPGKDKQLLHYVCACNIDGKIMILDPERQKSCEKKGYDFNKYQDGMTYILPEENFCNNKIGKTGVGPKASDYLSQPYAIYGQGLDSLDKILSYIEEKENEDVHHNYK